MQHAEEQEIFHCFLQYRNYGAPSELIRFKDKVCFHTIIIMVLGVMEHNVKFSELKMVWHIDDRKLYKG